MVDTVVQPIFQDATSFAIVITTFPDDHHHIIIID